MNTQRRKENPIKSLRALGTKKVAHGVLRPGIDTKALTCRNGRNLAFIEHLFSRGSFGYRKGKSTHCVT